MKTSDFYYDLPEELIAQTPIEPRNASRLMVLNKETGEVEHKIFKDLTSSYRYKLKFSTMLFCYKYFNS